MANPVSTAIGTQRQFAKQPERVYQANLKNPSFSRGISVSADEGAKLLARSLGVLGDAIVRESIASDNRKKELGTAEAERRFEVTSEEDKHKLAALDILGRNSDFDMSDNPYAVARVEELRGQYLSKQYKNRYETEVLPTQELAPNSQANAKQFEDFMKACLEEDNVKITNNVAFSEGFYGNRPNDLLEIDAKYRQRKQADLIADRNAGITSKMDSILSASINTPPEELAGLMQDLQVDGAITNLSLSERVKLFSEAGKQIAGNGNPEQLKAWGETVAWFDSNTGKEKRIKDILPMGEFMTISAKANVAMNEAATRDFFKSIEDVPSAALEEHFEKLKGDNPFLYKAVAGKYDELYAKKQKEEAKALKTYAATQEATYQRATAFSMMNDKYNAYCQGDETEPKTRLGSTTNDYIFNGKIKTFNDLDAYDWYMSKVAENANTYKDAEDPLDFHKANLRLLTFPPVKSVANRIGSQAQTVLATLNLNTLQTGLDGSKQLPDTINSCLNWYRVDPSTFSTIFPSKLTEDMNTLNTLVTSFGTEDGVVEFAKARALLADKDHRENVNKLTNKSIERILTVPDVAIMGRNGSDKLSLSNANYCVRGLLETMISSNIAAGMNPLDAEAVAKNKVANSFYNYDGVAIPKAFIRNIQSTNQANICAGFLGAKRKEVAKNGNVEDTIVMYVPGTNQIRISHKNSEDIYLADIGKFTIDANKYLASLPEAQRITLEDVYGHLEDKATDNLGGIYD